MHKAKKNETIESMSTAPSSELLAHFRNGSEQAADQLYQRYAGRLRQLAHAKSSKLLRSRLDADDIVQSVFRRFFEASSDGHFDCPTDEDLWNVLLVITLNRLRTEEVFQRAGKRDVRRTVNVAALAELTSFSHSDYAATCLRDSVREALAQLPEHFAQVIQLRLEGFEVAEIAQQVGRPKRTVERMLQEAHTRLQASLKPSE